MHQPQAVHLRRAADDALRPHWTLFPRRATEQLYAKPARSAQAKPLPGQPVSVLYVQLLWYGLVC